MRPEAVVRMTLGPGLSTLAEIAEALRFVATDIESGIVDGDIFDKNNRIVGIWWVEPLPKPFTTSSVSGA